jgi:hypothetical protein
MRAAKRRELGRMFKVDKDPHGCPMITIRSGIFVLRRDGILVGKPTEADVNVADAIEMVAAMKKLVPGGHMKVLLDQRNVSRKILPDARNHLLTNTANFERLAILVSNTISRFFASGILAASVGSKARAFDSESAAVTWLLSPAVVAARR